MNLQQYIYLFMWVVGVCVLLWCVTYGAYTYTMSMLTRDEHITVNGIPMVQCGTCECVYHEAEGHTHQ